MEARIKDLYLAHHGILGQKWGVRRYQNKDGTLTEEGKRRIRETSKYYLNPQYKEDKKRGINTDYREKVSQEFASEFWEAVDNNRMKLNVPDLIDKRIWDKYKDKYAEATLRDVGVEVTKAGKDFVKKCLSEDDSYEYPINPEEFKIAKRRAVDNAEKNDIYALDFQEATQNLRKADPGSSIYDKKWLLEEYSKYLDNPESYMMQDRESERKKQEREEYELTHK